MDSKEMIMALEKDIQESKIGLQAKKILLKRLKKQTRTPLMETWFGRGVDKALVVLTAPFARIHDSAQMRLENPRGYRAEKALKKAEKLAQKCQETSSSAGKRAARLAVKAALSDAALSEFQELSGYSDRISEVRKILRDEAKRLGAPIIEEAGGMDIDSLMGTFGLKAQGA